MKPQDKQHISLQARFSLATVLSVIAFIVIVLILLVSFAQVRSDIRQVSGEQRAGTVESFRKARDLEQFFSRLKLFEATFYDNDEFLQLEGAHLLKRVRHYEKSMLNSTLKTKLLPLREQLRAYLEQCSKVNELLGRLRGVEEGLDEVFVILEELTSEQMVAAALQGGKFISSDQLIFLVANHRIALMEIVQSNVRGKPEQFFNASFFDPPPNSVAIANLIQRLKSLLTAAPPLDRFGRHLIDQLKYYQHLSSRFQQEMIHLGQQTELLNQLIEAVLRKLEALDWQLDLLAEQTEEQIDQQILKTGIVVLGLLSALVLVLGLIQLNLFSRHVKRPMQAVRKRLLSFQQGDYSTPMTLERNDEWAQLEIVFNDMLGDLVESWGAVQESERRYREIFDNASFGIFQSKIDGTLLNINATLALMFGIDAFEDIPSVEDLGAMIYVNPQDREQMISRLLQEETISNFEVQLRRTDGEIFWAALTCHVVLSNTGEVQLVEGTVEDISQRRKAEAELRNLKNYLHDIVDTMPSILIGVDEDLQVSLWNQQVEDLSGISSAQALQRPLGEVFSLIDTSRCLASVGETLQTKEVVRLRKIPGISSGAGRFFDMLIYPLTTPEASGVVIHMDDVTEKARIEEVMVQSEKMLSVGSLAAGMAHEINNPLASVLQNVQVMKQRLSPSLKKNREVAEQLGISIEQVSEYAQLRGLDKMIKSVADAGQRAARIIENMLNFSRKSDSSFLPRSLVDLVEKTIELAGSDYDMKHHFDFREINIARDFQPAPDVPCETGQIQQVILSLLKNAAQALGRNTQNPQISIRIFPQDDQVCLQIEDNGEGMDETTRRRIFEPFFTTKEVGQGSGLGLAVSYFLIVENHNGSLTVSSQPGKGSCFSVLLPIERAAQGELICRS